MDINVADATHHTAQASGNARPRVFSGMQPSGDFQLGNYLGALKNWVLGQHEKENFFCVVDLHSLTVPQDPEDLRQRTRALAAMYLAAGIDPERSTLFIQSHVAAHAEGSISAAHARRNDDRSRRSSAG